MKNYYFSKILLKKEIMSYSNIELSILKKVGRNLLQSTPVNSYPDSSDLHVIPMYMRPPFRDDQINITRLFRISHYS